MGYHREAGIGTQNRKRGQETEHADASPSQAGAPGCSYGELGAPGQPTVGAGASPGEGAFTHGSRSCETIPG